MIIGLWVHFSVKEVRTSKVSNSGKLKILDQPIITGSALKLDFKVQNQKKTSGFSKLD